MNDLGVWWAAAGVPLLGLMIRACARWARGGSRAWLGAGVLAGACGSDGLLGLERRVRYLPLRPEHHGALWGLISGALLWVAWKEWRALGVSRTPPAGAG